MIVTIIVSLTMGMGCGGGDGESVGSGGNDSTSSQPVAAERDALRAAYVHSRQRGAGPKYAFKRERDALVFDNRRHGLVARFDDRGFSLRQRTRREGFAVDVAVDGYGCPGRLSETPSSAPVGDGNRIEQRHGPLNAWYLNGPLGLEQGFDLPAPPSCLAQDDTITVAMTVRGLVPSGGGAEVALRDRAHVARIRVDQLHVTDSSGAVLSARFRTGSGRVFIDIEAPNVQFPVTVDPIWVREQQLLAGEETNKDELGTAVSVSGDTAVVGAPGDDDDVPGSGVAYVFVRSGTVWDLQARLKASDEGLGAYFGRSVSIDGDTVVVGADEDDGAGATAGAAYVFVRGGTTWTEQAKIVAPDATADDRFGTSVSVSGDTAVIGSPLDDDAALDSGSAYVFVRGGNVWSMQAKLAATDGAAIDEFGRTVSVDGDTAVVGSPQDDDGGSNSGSVYVFTRTGATWSEQAKLTASDAAFTDELGSSVSVQGDTVVAGAPEDDDLGTASGSAYVFVRSGAVWTEEAKLLASDGTSGDLFGRAVSVDGDTAVVGAHHHDDVATNAGATYVFVRSGSAWSEQSKLTASDGSGGHRLGWAVDVDVDTVVAGAPFEDWPKLDAGSAYAYARSGTTWSEEGKLSVGLVFTDDNMGWSVSLDGDTAVVGAPADADAYHTAGIAYVFVRSGGTWTLQAKLTPSDLAPTWNFGRAVSVDGDTAVVGAPGADSMGAVYVFVRSGSVWVEQTKLIAGDAALSDDFGSAVELDGDTALIGAYRDDDGGSESGSSYVFTRTGTTWSQQAKLTASDAVTGQQFGISVGLSGDDAIVGAPGSSAGAAYVYVRSGGVWTEQAKLVAPDGVFGDDGGTSVAIDGITAVFGAPNHQVVYSGDGAAYVFRRPASSWLFAEKLSGSNPGNNDAFGHAVTIDFDTIVVGAPAYDVGTYIGNGALYVFARVVPYVWVEEGLVFETSESLNRWLGNSVSVSGETVIAGAPLDDKSGSAAGAAYVYIATGDPYGAACMSDADCLKGFCRDGVCCDTHCNGGSDTDCMSCLAAFTGLAMDGTCAPIPAGSPCRFGSGDACDPDELCDGSTMTCPPDQVAPNGTVCRSGSGDLCDPAETCSGVSGQACPTDQLAAPGTVCNVGSGDACDPDETCSGTPGQPCPADLVAPSTTVCNPGSGDLCDPDETCPGVAGQPCPPDVVAPTATVCQPGSGDLCDPAETCSGVADQPCPTDVVAAANTVCNPGSGDVCDPDETCTGVAGQPCPADVVAPTTTVCNAGSGDVCDPDETCSGVADQPCPTDVIAPTTMVCNPGSGDVCDPDETCTGVAGQPCPADVVAPAATICNPGSGDACDPDETCTGVADQACPIDVIAPSTTVCNSGSGDLCDPDETCTGVADQPCPPDAITPSTVVCNSGSGDLCDPDESCPGIAGQPCPADVVAPPTTVCRGAVDLCDLEELCTGNADSPCPADGKQPTTHICRPAAESCDVAELCDGSNDACPPDDVASSGSEGDPTCAPYLCDGSMVTCPSSCAGAGECASGSFCDGSACIPLLDDGEPCTSADVCDNGFCVDGLCCDTTCDGGCESCDSSVSPGACAPLAAGTECRAAFDDCDAPELCDGSAGACPTDGFAPDGAPCDDGQGVCAMGSCQPPGEGGAGGTPGGSGGGGLETGIGGSVPSGDGVGSTDADGGCGCSTPGQGDPTGVPWLLLGFVGLAVGARRTEREIAGERNNRPLSTSSGQQVNG